MSRIGKMPVPVPSTVKVNLSGRSISVEGPKGKLQLDLPERTEAKMEDDQIIVTRENDEWTIVQQSPAFVVTHMLTVVPRVSHMLLLNRYSRLLPVRNAAHRNQHYELRY
jgi:ribosomal protein L6P/L9E